jgi:DNA-binding MarR family transcriptional regulator
MAGARWLSEQQQQAWRAFQRTQAWLNAELARDLSLHSELSYQDYVVLVALTDRPGGSMRLFELGRRLGWEKSRTSHQVKRMQGRGLLDKSACGQDRRGAYVRVTDDGRRAIESAAPSHVDAVRRLFVDRLTDEQMVALHALCEAVLPSSSNCTPGAP